MGPVVLAQVSTGWVFLGILLSLIVGAGAAVVILRLLAKAERLSAESEATKIIKAAQNRAQEIVRLAEVETKAGYTSYFYVSIF